MKDLWSEEKWERHATHFQMGRLGGKECLLKITQPFVSFLRDLLQLTVGLKTKEYRRWSSETSNKTSTP